MKTFFTSLLVMLCLLIHVKAQVITPVITSAPFSEIPGSQGDYIYIHPPPGYPPYLPSGSWYVNNTTKGGRVARIRTSFLMEYGDGGFTTIDSAVHVYRIPNPILLLTMRGKYDTIHPHGNVVAQTLQPTSINAAASQHLLPSGTNIMLTSDVIDLMAADTIQTVITFKKRFTGRGKILFYYNGIQRVFKTISQGNNEVLKMIPGLGTFKTVRTYQDPLVPDLEHTVPGSLTRYSPYDVMGNNTTFNYVNNAQINLQTPDVMVFDLPESFDTTREHNIFISLFTLGSEIYRAPLAGSSIKAYIVEDKEPASTDQQGLDHQLIPNSAGIDFLILQGDPDNPNPNQLLPHDPNYIIADKRCINTCDSIIWPGPAVNPGESFNYRVHFQNDGAGRADSIIVTVFLHKKLDTVLTNISANVAGVPVTGNKLKIAPAVRAGEWNRIVFTLYDSRRANAQVHLYGTQGMKMPETDFRTMGDIKFTVRSRPGTKPSYFSIASIVFETQLPVVTRMNRIKCCERMTNPNIPVNDPVPPRPFGRKGRDISDIDGKPAKAVEIKKVTGKVKQNG